MKIVLVSINSQFFHSNLANLYIVSNFDANADLVLLDFNLKDSFGTIVERIFLEKPDLLAFSTYVWNIELITALAGDFKNILPQCAILLGGPEADYNYKKLIINPGIDYIFRGEGDGAFSEFASALIAGVDLPPFIATKARPEAVQTFSGNLELLGRPYNNENIGNYKNHLVYYETSRGCPYACSYCLSSAIKGMRFFNLDQIEMDFRLFILAGIKTVKLVDRTFNSPEPRAIKLLELMKKLHAELAGATIFHVELVADQLSDSFIAALETMPKDLVQIEIGVQTTNDQTLYSINRTVNSARLQENVKKILALRNTHVHLDLIAGLPFETMPSFIESINFVLSLNPHHVQLGFLKKITGTELPEQVEHEMVFSAKPPYEIYQNKYMSFADLSYLKKVEHLIDKYYNSGRFNHIWRYLVEIYYLDNFSFCADLVKYFDEFISPESSFSPRNLFSYLHDFIGYKVFPEKDFLIEVLSFDYLLQEKPKYFPDWMPYKKNKELVELAKKQPFLPEGKATDLVKIQDKIHASYLNLQISRQNARYILSPTLQSEAVVFYYPEHKTRLDINEARHLEVSA